MHQGRVVLVLVLGMTALQEAAVVVHRATSRLENASRTEGAMTAMVVVVVMIIFAKDRSVATVHAAQRVNVFPKRHTDVPTRVIE